MRNLPPLKTLPVFEAVAKHLSISKAADELFVTHSAVSQAIKHLEEQLNTVLLKRDKRNMELTRSGKDFLFAIQNGLDNIENGMLKLQRQHDPYSIKINMPTSFATAWFVPRLNDFETQHPEYQLTINTPAQTVNFDEQQFDCSIYSGQDGLENLTTELLFAEEIFLICKPGLIKKSTSMATAIAKYPLIMIDSPRLKDKWTTWCKEKGLALPNKKQQLIFNHPLIAIQAAKKGLGIMLSNQLLAKPGLQSKQLIRPFKDSLTTTSNYYLAYPSKYQHSKKLQIFSQWMKKQIYDEAH